MSIPKGQSIPTLNTILPGCECELVIESNVFKETVAAILINGTAVCGVSIDLKEDGAVAVRNKVTGVTIITPSKTPAKQ
jgi:hypothetical protein